MTLDTVEPDDVSNSLVRGAPTLGAGHPDVATHHSAATEQGGVDIVASLLWKFPRFHFSQFIAHARAARYAEAKAQARRDMHVNS